MHKVLAHDLPNELVVMQSLLQLLDQEEGRRLSDDGREFVRRLRGAARRTADLARFLKEMERIRTFRVRSEPIELTGLARELEEELRRVHPGTHFEFAWQWQTPTLFGDSRVIVLALGELCPALLLGVDRCLLRGGAKKTSDGVELTWQLNDSASCSIEALEQRMEIILARTWLELCGVQMDLTLPAGGGVRVCMTMTKR
jgi:signal transduction histidine kinase